MFSLAILLFGILLTQEVVQGAHISDSVIMTLNIYCGLFIKTCSDYIFKSWNF